MDNRSKDTEKVNGNLWVDGSGKFLLKRSLIGDEPLFGKLHYIGREKAARQFHPAAIEECQKRGVAYVGR